MATYAAMLESQAQALDRSATARTFKVVRDDENSVFEYIDTASSRAGIAAVSAKLERGRVGIVGIGGTGAYLLDLVAKTPVPEIHLWDGDLFLQHNAFRAPGGASIDELELRPKKVEHFAAVYSRMRRGVVAHPEYVTDENVAELCELDFVFLALDDGEARKMIVQALERAGVPFIDVGMGIYEADGALGGLVRVTTSTPQRRSHVWNDRRIPFGAEAGDNEYDRNIQIADLNALNATLAVIKWKKLWGFYIDLEHEHFSVYELNGNALLTDDSGDDEQELRDAA
jgi:hypothetical protein